MGLRDSISKTLGKANNFINDKQRRYRLKDALENETLKLSSLFIELGKSSYYSTGRNIEEIKQDITSCINNIDNLNLELNSPTV